LQNDVPRFLLELKFQIKQKSKVGEFRHRRYAQPKP